MRVTDRVGLKVPVAGVEPVGTHASTTPPQKPPADTPKMPWAPTTTRPPTSNLSTRDVARSQLEAQTRPPPDGHRFARERLAEIAALARLGVPTAVVFDLDNTLFDTRHRTLSAGRAFDAAKGTRFFADVDVAAMGVDGHATATALGLEDPHHADFVAFWDVHFWTPEHLAHDAPIDEMVALVRAAQAAGAEVTFLTGRIQSFHAASLDQLRAAGLDVDADDVVCKPDLSVRTGPFKSAWLEEMRGCGVEIGFFVTEGVRDLTHLAATLPDLPLLRLDCSFEDGAGLAHLPTLPKPF
jgi:phosphoglycolate phosphatase-like HAD superfamily hydrolase